MYEVNFDFKRPEKNNRKFTGYVMYKDEPVVRIVENNVKSIEPSGLIKVPIHFQVGGLFESWMESRLIDLHRKNSRQVRRRLSLGDKNDINLVLQVHAASLVDQFWTKPDGSNLTFKDVHSFSDELSDIALYGKYEKSDEFVLTPELTNTGSFEKCWKLLGGKWYLIKGGSQESNFGEILSSKLGKRLGFNCVDYQLYHGERNLVMCENFVDDNSNFEAMYHLVGEDEDVRRSIEIFKHSNIDVSVFLDICFLDSLVFNADRHTHNYGLVSTHLEDGRRKFSVAPNFDNNLAMLAFGGFGDCYKNQISFTDSLHDILKDEGYVKPSIDWEEFRKELREIYSMFDRLIENEEFYFNFIKYRYDRF